MSSFIHNVKSDLRNYSSSSFFKAMLLEPGFKYTFHHRLNYLLSQKKILKPFYLLHRLYFLHLEYIFGMHILPKDMPKGFRIAHFGGITFVPKAVGENCFIRQNVTVGANNDNGKDLSQNPIIGNNVTFGANSVAIGPIVIGNNVYIGAGAVVTKDIPDNCIVAGVPAKIIKRIN